MLAVANPCSLKAGSMHTGFDAGHIAYVSDWRKNQQRERLKGDQTHWIGQLICFLICCHVRCGHGLLQPPSTQCTLWSVVLHLLAIRNSVAVKGNNGRRQSSEATIAAFVTQSMWKSEEPVSPFSREPGWGHRGPHQKGALLEGALNKGALQGQQNSIFYIRAAPLKAFCVCLCAGFIGCRDHFFIMYCTLSCKKGSFPTPGDWFANCNVLQILIFGM